MAGEWLALDIGLPDKPEVQELIDLTDEPVEVVVYRLFRLWGWASMHCTDGTARMTLPRLVRTCGGDEAFWRAVAAVGWLEIDQTAATVAVPGWDRRFSQAAKSRAQHADRSRAYEDRHPARKGRAGTPGARAPDDPAPERRRGEEKRSPPPPREASRWEDLRAAWNAGSGRPWTPPEPAKGAMDRLAEPGWLDQAVEAIARLPACRYFSTPVTLVQFCGAGFVARVLGGQYDAPKTPKGVVSPAGDGRKAAADAAAEWERGLADPERIRRQQEFKAAKAARQQAAALAAKLKIAEEP